MNNHFAAHQENVIRRNADFDHIYRTMTFNKPHGSTGIFIVKCLLEVLLSTNIVTHDPITHFLCCTTASATSVQLHKAVSVCDHQTVFTTITD